MLKQLHGHGWQIRTEWFMVSKTFAGRKARQSDSSFNLMKS